MQKAIFKHALADEIMDEQQQLFALSGIVVACDKFITKNMLEEIRRRISLTKIGLLFEKEKMEYASKLAKEAEKSKAITVAEKMLKKGYDLSDIMEVTGLTEVEILLLDK